uniref:Endoglucanase n=1 Tax=Ovatospora brasiliensis TaxID=1934393 RepID=Q8NJZ6_9PEZI|nr:endoglucanase [Ovatospora brasiliensis]
MKLTLVLFVSSLAAATPLGWRERRQQVSLCGQSSSWSGNGYQLNNNLWGQSRATSGSQCTYLDSSSNSGIHWHTTWTWEGGEGEVKSYAYSGRQVSTGLTIASIDSMQTSVSWEYNTTDIQANVAYDIFTAEDPDHEHSSGDYEVMIWLARYNNVSPIGSSVATATVGGDTWDLFAGANGDMEVYSFVAENTMNSFSGDVKDFFDYLEQNVGFPVDDQYLLVFELGSEAFTGGPATLSVSQFSANIA